MQIIVGSQMGGTEYVAEHIAECLAQENVQTHIHLEPDLSQLSNEEPWLVITSTHGAGDYPDNLLAFVDQLTSSDDLNAVRFAIIGIGDSSYDTYNFAAKNLEQLLLTKGAQQLTPRLEIDVLEPELPEDTAEQWLPQLSKSLTPS